jgi:hypothetical protein
MNRIRPFAFLAGLGVFLSLTETGHTAGPPLRPDLGPVADHVLVFNGTAGTIRCETLRKGTAAVAYELAPDAYYVFYRGAGLVCRHGSLRVEFQAGSLYQFRPDPMDSTKVVIRRLVLRPTDERPPQPQAEVAGRMNKLEPDSKESRTPAVPFAGPVLGDVHTKITRLPTEGGTLAVLAWPSAAVCLVDKEGSSPSVRTYLGRTPLACRLPPGRYQILLEQPAPGEGEWLAPAGRPVTLGSAGREAKCLEVDATLTKDAPSLVRAMWVTPTGTTAGRLDAATRDGPDLFPSLRATDARLFCARTFGRARVTLTQKEEDELAAVLRRTGWLRYPLSEKLSVDFEFVAGSSGPLQAKFVKTGPR